MIPLTLRQRPNVGREAPVLAVEDNELLQVDGYGRARPLTAVRAPREPSCIRAKRLLSASLAQISDRGSVIPSRWCGLDLGGR